MTILAKSERSRWRGHDFGNTSPRIRTSIFQFSLNWFLFMWYLKQIWVTKVLKIGSYIIIWIPSEYTIQLYRVSQKRYPLSKSDLPLGIKLHEFIGVFYMFHILNSGFEIKWSSQLWTQFKQLRIEAWKSQDFNETFHISLHIHSSRAV